MISFLFSNASSFIISLISLILAIYTVVKDLPSKPTYTKMTKCLIHNDINQFKGLSLKFNNVDIPQFSITTIVFWNGGKSKLTKDDYGKVIPKITAINDCSILHYNVLYKNDDKFVNLNFELKDNELDITFERLRKKQGFAIEIWHTCETNKDLKIDFIFCDTKTKYIFSPHKSNKKLIDKLILSLFYIIGSLLLILKTITYFLNSHFGEGIFFSITTVISLIGIWDSIIRLFIPYVGVPFHFHKFLNNIDEGND